MGPKETAIHIGLTRDFLEKAADPWRMGLSWLRQQQQFKWSWFEEYLPEVHSKQLGDCDVVLSWTPKWTAASLERVDKLLLIARWGVGYDHLDIDACTKAGVMVAITPEAVRRPVATANVAMMMALATGLMHKDRDARAGLWQQNSLVEPGFGLVGKTLGSIGFGNVAQETFRLMSGFSLKYMACTLHPDRHRSEAVSLGVELTDLASVVRESDYLMINCPLKSDTLHLLGARELAAMKRSAYLINLSRGAIVEEQALIEALRQRRIAGAGLDVFEREPLPAGHPLTELPQVILTPHTLALTDDLFAGMEKQHREMYRALHEGAIPPHVVNREVLDSPRLREKLAALQDRLKHNRL
jgi:phosphoglycerate dehydrogenase-like enzyme